MNVHRFVESLIPDRCRYCRRPRAEHPSYPPVVSPWARRAIAAQRRPRRDGEAAA